MYYLFWHETLNFGDAACNINMKYKCIHETKKIKYAIINVNYEKKKKRFFRIRNLWHVTKSMKI